LPLHKGDEDHMGTSAFPGGGEETVGSYNINPLGASRQPDPSTSVPSSTVKYPVAPQSTEAGVAAAMTPPPEADTKDEPSSPTYFPSLPESPSLPGEAPKKLIKKIPKSKRGLTPDQPSSVTADDYSRMTGNFVDKTTGEAMKGPALADVVGGTGGGYDKWATAQERQERAEQFLKDYPAVDVTGKSRAQVQSEMADASEKYLKNVEEGEEQPTRDVAVKRPLSERAPEYRDTKEGREYWVPTDPPLGSKVKHIKGGVEFDPQQGGWGKWERNPIEDLNYPDERFRRATGPIPADKRTPETRQAQLDLAAQLKTPLANDPNYWLDFSNAEELEGFRKSARENGVTSRQFDAYIDKVTKKVKFDVYRAGQAERLLAQIENPANWAKGMGMQDPGAIARTRKRAYPDQTAEQAKILSDALDKLAREKQKEIDALEAELEKK
tara:strand:- start:2049 stop:3365 length:1317 start_codon:yes stop_codon:yes gene_type:complete